MLEGLEQFLANEKLPDSEKLDCSQCKKKTNVEK